MTIDKSACPVFGAESLFLLCKYRNGVTRKAGTGGEEEVGGGVQGGKKGECGGRKWGGGPGKSLF